jgi:hypothetical protein
MKMKTMRAGIVLTIFGLLLWMGVSWSSDAPAGYKNPDQAMQAFTQAMLQKNPRQLLTFFSKTSTWRYLSYGIGANTPSYSKQVSYANLVTDFKRKNNWYGFFFNEPNGYTFRINFMRGERWRKEGPALFIAPRSESGRTYVKWKQEHGKWVIAEISETAP